MDSIRVMIAANDWEYTDGEEEPDLINFVQEDIEISLFDTGVPLNNYIKDVLVQEFEKALVRLQSKQQRLYQEELETR